MPGAITLHSPRIVAVGIWGGGGGTVAQRLILAGCARAHPTAHTQSYGGAHIRRCLIKDPRCRQASEASHVPGNGLQGLEGEGAQSRGVRSG